MTDQKFDQSCLRFKQAMERENRKRRMAIEIETPPNTKVKVTSVETNFPKLNIQDLINNNAPKSDVLIKLAQELGIDQDDENPVPPMSLKSKVLIDLVQELEIDQDEDEIDKIVRDTLSNIKPIQAGKRTRFRYGSVEIHIRSSLDVWLKYRQVKFVFPKPRSDAAIEASVP